MAQRFSLSHVVIALSTLGCAGLGQPPEDSDPLYCYQEQLADLLAYCDGPIVADDVQCPGGQVRINCISVRDYGTESFPPGIDEDRCAPAQYMQSICGEVIPCSVTDDDTLYPLCGA